MLIGAILPAAVQDWRYLMVPVLAGVLAFVYHPAIGRMERSVPVLDAFGLGVLLRHGLAQGAGLRVRLRNGRADGHGHPRIGGGMLRDLLAGRVPAVFLRGELYATPALRRLGRGGRAGAHRPAASWTNALAGGGFCTARRLVAIWRHWQAPVPTGPASVGS